MSIPARAVLECACVMGPNLDYEQTGTHCLAVYLMHSVWDWKAATGSLLFLLLFSRIYSDPGIVLPVKEWETKREGAQSCNVLYKFRYINMH